MVFFCAENNNIMILMVFFLTLTPLVGLGTFNCCIVMFNRLLRFLEKQIHHLIFLLFHRGGQNENSRHSSTP